MYLEQRALGFSGGEKKKQIRICYKICYNFRAVRIFYLQQHDKIQIGKKTVVDINLNRHFITECI